MAQPDTIWRNTSFTGTARLYRGQLTYDASRGELLNARQRRLDSQQVTENQKSNDG